MGQYYKPISLTRNQHLYSHDYDNGLKLMEHSWVGNYFVNTVMSLLKRSGAWYNNRIVWAGDYADDEPKLNENLYGLQEKENRINPKEDSDFLKNRYLVNVTKKEFVDVLRKYSENKETNPNDVWVIHPLPLLTCEGNGRGGGDLHKHVDHPIIGSWARNRLYVTKKRPNENIYKEIIFDLEE